MQKLGYKMTDSSLFGAACSKALASYYFIETLDYLCKLFRRGATKLCAHALNG